MVFITSGWSRVVSTAIRIAVLEISILQLTIRNQPLVMTIVRDYSVRFHYDWKINSSWKHFRNLMNLNFILLPTFRDDNRSGYFPSFSLRLVDPKWLVRPWEFGEFEISHSDSQMSHNNESSKWKISCTQFPIALPTTRNRQLVTIPISVKQTPLVFLFRSHCPPATRAECVSHARALLGTCETQERAWDRGERNESGRDSLCSVCAPPPGGAGAKRRKKVNAVGEIEGRAFKFGPSVPVFMESESDKQTVEAARSRKDKEDGSEEAEGELVEVKVTKYLNRVENN